MRMEYEGLDIATDDNVYVPAEDSFLAAETIKEELDSFEGSVSVADIGCGSGILGLVAGTNPNVDKVVFADISDDALKLCQMNVDRNCPVVRANCIVKKSDLFSEVSGNFDLIIFNAPYLPDKDNSKIAGAWYGGKTGIEVSVDFLRQAVNHMNDESRIIIVESSFGDIDTLNREISNLGLYVSREKRQHISFEDIIVMVLGRADWFGS